MKKEGLIDHLFRHHYGKMVSILTRIFGLEHIETIEDAVQDTYAKAIHSWRNGIPENPEGWLTTAAKNRMLDLFRKLKSDKLRAHHFEGGTSSISLHELFLDDEIKDAQLRMIFTACHPELDSRDQIAFALKTIAGFSQKEIAASLLLKEETIKKRLTRARKAIQHEDVQFNIPQGKQLNVRLDRVLEVLYLIFNEGFHSIRKDSLVRKELCGEALRMCKMLIDSPLTAFPRVHALFALMCFHSARLDSKVSESDEIIDLKEQDRSKWEMPLIMVGHSAMIDAVKIDQYSSYHYEAAIAAEHLKAQTFEETDWSRIIHWYEKLQEVEPSPFNLLNMAVVHLQCGDIASSKAILKKLDPKTFEQRKYLYYGCLARLYLSERRAKDAIQEYDKAIELVGNELEKSYLLKKRNEIEIDDSLDGVR